LKGHEMKEGICTLPKIGCSIDLATIKILMIKKKFSTNKN